MKVAVVASLAACIAAVHAHTTVYGLWVNNVFQGDGRNQYIRSPPNNNPVKDLTSSAMTCNVNNNAVSRFVSVKSGDQLTFEWYHDARNDDIIDKSHKGPVQVYVAPQGQVWTKIFSQGYTGGQWATDKLIAAHGQHSVIVPDLPAGQYLFRAEIVALHEADVAYANNPVRGAQNYMSCSQILVTSNGTQSLSGGIALPGAYTPQTPGIVFNLYLGGPDPNTYQAPGPSVWSGARGGSVAQIGNA
ncbi:glycoside hydrolase family 61 protein [Exidia glandulosa HHB12029]|uniref:AA9 family lytic polysaccharide monooxygenase n=1 Tax=Exidia glandulosa HHB12029 TaxID=1314781 RepID=A0A165NEV4_EXIGL|nr:glycoside hydrolase family 61 protein [Exidia glandulosa HHB12029]